MSELAAYTKAMIDGRTYECIRIEKAHGLYGWTPEIVSVGLKAIDEGADPDAAIDAYMNDDDGEDHTA